MFSFVRWSGDRSRPGSTAPHACEFRNRTLASATSTYTIAPPLPANTRLRQRLPSTAIYRARFVSPVTSAALWPCFPATEGDRARPSGSYRPAVTERDVPDAAESPDGGLSALEVEISGPCAVVAVGGTARAIGEISAILEWAIADRVVSGSRIVVVGASMVD